MNQPSARVQGADVACQVGRADEIDDHIDAAPLGDAIYHRLEVFGLVVNSDIRAEAEYGFALAAVGRCQDPGA
ncbi:hypothetical protein D3C71_1872200 [compost metagenome]